MPDGLRPCSCGAVNRGREVVGLRSESKPASSEHLGRTAGGSPGVGPGWVAQLVKACSTPRLWVESPSFRARTRISQ